MTELEERQGVDEENDEATGYGAAIDGAADEAPDQQQHPREPVSEDEAEQDNYANTDDKVS